jgi:hypothetical protein
VIFIVRAVATAISAGLFVGTGVIALARVREAFKTPEWSATYLHAIQAGLWTAAATLAALSGVAVWL